MSIDKELFMYDLAVVAFVKNDAPYVAEWLDYHLAAGVDHFYIYDNESSDNLKEILQPYIDGGLVTYQFCLGANKKIAAYTEAFKNYKFFCRYMAFIGVDEFIFPQNKKSIAEAADKIFIKTRNAGGLEVLVMPYGSNFHESADFSRGVLDRFTRRASKVYKNVRTIANPRKIKYVSSADKFAYFAGVTAIDDPTSRIFVNRYEFKSYEEFLTKQQNKIVREGESQTAEPVTFSHELNNDVFDDSILTYRDACRGNYLPPQIVQENLINALFRNIAPVLGENIVPEFFIGGMETFLTCRALAAYLKENVLDETRGAFLERAALNAVYQAAVADLSFADAQLLFGELPQILQLNYPIVEDIRRICIEFIAQMQEVLLAKMTRTDRAEYGSDFNSLEDLSRLLKVFDSYSRK